MYLQKCTAIALYTSTMVCMETTLKIGSTLHVSKNLAILILIYPGPKINAKTPNEHPE